MPSIADITDALGIAEDAILAALRIYGEAWWNGEVPQGTTKRLQLAPGDPDYLPRYLVAQHQDGGGGRDPHLSSAAWSGLVVVRCLSRDRGQARAGYAHTATAMGELVSPAGYTIAAQFDRPIAVPADGLILTRAAQWRVTVRRV